MKPSSELPECLLAGPPLLIPPSGPTPRHPLYLSNLDDQTFLRFSIKYLYLFKRSIPVESLKRSLAGVLVDYYPLAGRLRATSDNDGHKLEVDCNGEGALFAEAFTDITAADFLELSRRPNRSWRKLLYRVDGQSFVDVPPVIIQVTHLRCGGMILCTAISHSLCDGVGTSQFLHAWAHLTSNPHSDPPIKPLHDRHVLRPRKPTKISCTHHQFTNAVPEANDCGGPPELHRYLRTQPLVPASITFSSSQVVRLKKRCVPSVKCTTFEVLAAHTWRSWVRSLDPAPSVNVKLLFSVNVRDKFSPQLSPGFYGNGFVLGCARDTAKDLVHTNLSNAVKLVQHAKLSITEDYVRSMIDLLEDETVRTDLSNSLVISQWSRLGLEELDFGAGRPIHMGPVTSDIYCLFLPVAGDPDSVRVLVSMPACVVERFECYMREFDEDHEEGDEIAIRNGFHGQDEGWTMQVANPSVTESVKDFSRKDYVLVDVIGLPTNVSAGKFAN